MHCGIEKWKQFAQGSRDKVSQKGLSAIHVKAQQTTGLCALGLNIHLSEFSFIFYSCIHMIITLYSTSVTSILQLLVAFVLDLLERNIGDFQSQAWSTYPLADEQKRPQNYP